MLFDLIQEEVDRVRSTLIAAVLLSGLSNASMLFLLHEDTLTLEEPNARLFLTLLGACALYALCLRQCIRALSNAFESALCNVRCRIADKLCRVDRTELEKIGATEIYNQITQQTVFISNSAWTLGLALHALVLLVFTALYISTLSIPAFLLVVAVDCGGGLLYIRRRRRARSILYASYENQKSLFRDLTDLLRGTKEVRLRSQRATELLADMQQLMQALKASPIQINQLNQENSTFLRVMLFLTLACLVYVLPSFSVTDPRSCAAQIAAVVFMFGPLGSLLKALPEYERADLAAERIRALETRLDAALLVSWSNVPALAPLPSHFSGLRAEGLVFQHKDAAGRSTFKMGPVSLSIKAGEIVFIVGGNGSGKTTLLRLLASVYPPTLGTLSVDGTAISAQNLDAYRSMIAAVFSDFHVFKRLYGMSGLTDEQVNRTLDLMKIADRTSCLDGIFSTLALSTGQRKRLAMAVALLEDRPIYFFDEWASDQDPEFRRYYYETLLPELKRRGKTVLAISHDDRYFRCADRVITMDYGTIRSITPDPDSPHRLGRPGQAAT